MIQEPYTFANLNNHYLKALESPWYRMLVLLENFVSEETMRFYHEKGIITLHLPVTTGSISSPMGRGSDSKPVKVQLEGVDTYLADSMQFMLEYGCRLHSRGCYYLMPTFRGEQADERHLCQFYHSEAEIPGTLQDIMALAESYVLFLVRRLLELHRELLIQCCGDIGHIEAMARRSPFPKLTFQEAEQLMREMHPHDIEHYIEHKEGYRNITRLAERELANRYGAVWLTNYDDLAVPFYQKKAPDGTACNADLLMGIGETIGCGERHGDEASLLAALERHQVVPDEYEWYITMKRRFPMNTSGFGMGVERFLMWVLKASDIRNFQLCPRFNGSNIVP